MKWKNVDKRENNIILSELKMSSWLGNLFFCLLLMMSTTSNLCCYGRLFCQPLNLRCCLASFFLKQIIVVSRAYVHKAKGYEFCTCTCTQKNSQSQHCIQYIKYSDWTILENKYKTLTVLESFITMRLDDLKLSR